MINLSCKSYHLSLVLWSCSFYVPVTWSTCCNCKQIKTSCRQVNHISDYACSQHHTLLVAHGHLEITNHSCLLIFAIFPIVIASAVCGFQIFSIPYLYGDECTVAPAFTIHTFGSCCSLACWKFHATHQKFHQIHLHYWPCQSLKLPFQFVLPHPLLFPKWLLHLHGPYSLPSPFKMLVWGSLLLLILWLHFMPKVTIWMMPQAWVLLKMEMTRPWGCCIRILSALLFLALIEALLKKGAWILTSWEIFRRIKFINADADLSFEGDIATVLYKEMKISEAYKANCWEQMKAHVRKEMDERRSDCGAAIKNLS